MSFRYPGAWIEDGAFNPLTAPTGTPTYYPYLFAWGANNNGQLGNNSAAYRSSPQQIGALTDWSTVSGGYNSGYSVKTDGTLWSWGLNQYGQLGNSNTTNYSSPKQVGALTNW